LGQLGRWWSVEVDQTKTRVYGQEILVRVRPDALLGLGFNGWVRYGDLEDPHKSQGVEEATKIAAKSERDADNLLAERWITEKQIVELVEDTWDEDMTTQFATGTKGPVTGFQRRPRTCPLLVVRLKTRDPEGPEVKIPMKVVRSVEFARQQDEKEQRREQNAPGQHLSEADIAKMIVGNSELSTHTASKNVTLTDKIHYIDDEDMYRELFISDYVARAKNNRSRQTDTSLRAAGKAAYEKFNPNGFSAGNMAYVRAPRRGFGTEIHEALHLYSDTSVLATLGVKFNEGLTEYFTRLVCGNRIERNNEYLFELHMIQELADDPDPEILSQADLKNIYFNGEVDLLLRRLSTALGPKFRYSAFMQLVDSGEIQKALEYVSALREAKMSADQTRKTSEEKDKSEKDIASSGLLLEPRESKKAMVESKPEVGTFLSGADEEYLQSLLGGLSSLNFDSNDLSTTSTT
jgi:hypothetical protein